MATHSLMIVGGQLVSQQRGCPKNVSVNDMRGKEIEYNVARSESVQNEWNDCANAMQIAGPLMSL